MSRKYDLQRFLNAQRGTYVKALKEIKNGKKQTHWMWFIFPQLKGLGSSPTSEYYGIVDAGEAKAYMNNFVLRNRLKEITMALIDLPTYDATEVMGCVDAQKLKSCMTLFAIVCPEYPIFQITLNKFFHGERCERTRDMLGWSGIWIEKE